MALSSLRLSELTKTIQDTLDSHLAPSYWVVAEIGELRLATKGHCYLDLVEKEDEQILARVRANIWAYAYRNISTWFETITGRQLEPGLEILCQVSINYHPVFGLSLNISDIDPAYTLGAREQKRQQTIAQLQADGIFEMNKMLELPLVPQRIAVISSPSAAGFGDFMTQLANSSEGYQIEAKLFSATMQGQTAASSLVEALHLIVEHMEAFDLVVIIRGGGAQMDLDCFDDYNLCSHIAQFPLPVLTGIGHERDETIADLVAHTKLKTPTAAAEFLLNGFRVFEEQLNLAWKKIERIALGSLGLEEERMQQLHYRIKSQTRERLAAEKAQQNMQHMRLKTLATHRVGIEKMLIKQQVKSLMASSKRILKQEETKQANNSLQLKFLNPKHMLERGYSLSLLDGRIIKEGNLPLENQVITTLTAQYEIKSIMKEIEPRKNQGNA